MTARSRETWWRACDRNNYDGIYTLLREVSMAYLRIIIGPAATGRTFDSMCSMGCAYTAAIANGAAWLKRVRGGTATETLSPDEIHY